MKLKLSILALFAASVMWSQDTGTTQISLDNLEVPDNPAFILLDKAPATISRPNSTRALGLTLLQDIVSSGTLDNIAFEVTPFWMIKNENNSALKFYGVDKNKNQNVFSKLKLASVSMAYIKGDDSIINMALGVRTTIFEVKRKEDINDYFTAYSKIEKSLFQDQDLFEEYDKISPEPEEDDYTTQALYVTALQAYRVARETYVEKRKKDLNLDKDEAGNTMQEIINRKPAIAVDLAVAYNHRFLQSEFDSNGFGRFGIWSTTAVSLFLDKSKDNYDYVNIFGFVRYLKEENNAILTGAAVNEQFNAFDIGLKAELEFEKLSVAYEYINRSGDLEGYRSVGSIRYQVLGDIFISGSFGNNFEEQNDVIALFGIQWGVNNALQQIGVLKN